MNHRPDGNLRARPWTRAELYLLAGIVMVGLLYGWQVRFPDVLTGGDDLTNLLLARSIAQGGYRDLFFVGAPLHAHYPPLMPLWTWLLVEVGGGSLATVQAANLVLLIVIALCIADGLRRLGEVAMGLMGAALVVFNPLLVRHAGAALAELLLLALSTVAVWALLRSRETGASVDRWHAVAFLAAVGAFAAKTIGIATLATVIVVLALTHWRRATILGITAAAIGALWFGYVRIADSWGVTYSYLADLETAAPGRGLGARWSRVLSNAQYYLQEGIPEILGLYLVPGTPIDNLAWTVVLVPAGIVGGWWFRRRWPAVPLLLACTVPILLVWPWAMARLALPLIPAGLACLLVGSRELGQRMWGSRGGVAMAISVAAALGLSTAHATVDRWREAQSCPRHDIYAIPSRCTVPEERALVEAARYAATALPDSAIVLTNKPHVIYWFSGRRTVPIRALARATSETIAPMLKQHRVTHVLLSHMHPSEYRLLAPLMASQCSEWTSVMGTDGGSVLLAVRTAGAPDACEALRVFREWQPGVG